MKSIGGKKYTFYEISYHSISSLCLTKWGFI